MVTCIAFLLLGVGLAQAMALSFILTAMVLGMYVVNRSRKHGLHVRYTIERTGPVIYTLFFALVGARVQISLLATMGALGLAYVLLRTAGKFAGAWLGGQAGRAEPVVRNNLGLGLLSQAGVAIGLALHSYERFCKCGLEGEALGALVVSVVTASTFVLQLAGPLGAKWAISRAGEIGRGTAEHEPWG
jgi:Kef-type K+ transport system membrane component KefB